MQKLQKLWKLGADFLGSKYAIMGGAMSWVSERNLVSAISNEGGFGVIACSAMPPHLLEQEIDATHLRTKANFGVNLIILHNELDKLIEVCGKKKVSHVVLAGGLPKAETIQKLKEYCAKVICFAPGWPIARKLVRMGADALIIEGNEAGGHIGPVSTSVLAQEILPNARKEMPHIPVFVAGGIGRGEAIASYLEMGAAGMQLGTRFVCAKESIAHPKFKEVFIKSNARDAMPSVQLSDEFPVIPVRAIVNKATEDFFRIQKEVIEEFRAGRLDKNAAQLKIEHFWAGALRRAVIDGDVERGSLMAGQSVGMITKEQSVKEILEDLISQAEDFLEERECSNGC